jgi:ectoine hydroxylase-related dioxygenase (phytanoyl-CoA dioxygenase family)
MTTTEREGLDTRGYVVLANFLDQRTLEKVRNRVEQLYELEGENAGSEFRQEPGSRRLANLVDKGEVFQELAAEPRILDLVGYVLGDHLRNTRKTVAVSSAPSEGLASPPLLGGAQPRPLHFKLSSFNARSANPYSSEAQPLHCDSGALPDEHGYSVCNTIWLLDDFTPDNGATRVIPGSQNWRRLPQDSMADPAQPHSDEVILLAPAGSVIVMNTHAWHGGTANRSAAHRRALHAFYCRSDQPQQQYQKKLLRPETQAALSPELRMILALDDPLNDQVSSAETRSSGFLK